MQKIKQLFFKSQESVIQSGQEKLFNKVCRRVEEIIEDDTIQIEHKMVYMHLADYLAKIIENKKLKFNPLSVGTKDILQKNLRSTNGLSEKSQQFLENLTDCVSNIFTLDDKVAEHFSSDQFNFSDNLQEWFNGNIQAWHDIWPIFALMSYPYCVTSDKMTTVESQFDSVVFCGYQPTENGLKSKAIMVFKIDDSIKAIWKVGSEIIRYKLTPQEAGENIVNSLKKLQLKECDKTIEVKDEKTISLVVSTFGCGYDEEKIKAFSPKENYFTWKDFKNILNLCNKELYKQPVLENNGSMKNRVGESNNASSLFGISSEEAAKVLNNQILTKAITKSEIELDIINVTCPHDSSQNQNNNSGGLYKSFNN